MDKTIKGFSKLSKSDKINWLVDQYLDGDNTAREALQAFWLADDDQQRILDGFSENTITNFPMPFGVAPNFIIDGKPYCIPMVIEESSVVAAAAAAAKFWMTRGGFTTKIIGTTKIGQVHFKWSGNGTKLHEAFSDIKDRLIADTADITSRMRSRGGGITNLELLDFTETEPDLYQIRASFETCDSMGANFINSCLEVFAKSVHLLAA